MEQSYEDRIENKKKKKILKAVFITALIFISFILGNLAIRLGIVVGPNSDKYGYAINMAKKYPEFTTLFEVRNDIELLYDGKIDDKTLAESATKAMTDALGDQYTVYMNEDEYDKYMESNSGSFIGIGVYITLAEDKVVVSGLIEGGSAEKAGIKAGDVIVSVDSEEVGNDINKAVSLITGKEQKVLNIVLERENEGTINVEVARAKIETISVEGEMVNDEVGYIRLKNFNKNSSNQFATKVDELVNSGMKGLILDLRGNGGGYLDEAVNIASQFIENGKTVTYTIDKYNNKIVHKSNGEVIHDIPITMLIDGNSASASEVLTGALRDYGIANTVGVTSFGKGIVQEVFPLTSGNGGLKVTVSKYYTPEGENIHGTGIKPDYYVEIPEDVSNQEYSRELDTQYQKALEVMNDKLK